MVGKNVNVKLQTTIASLLTDRPIAYHPIIARAVKSVTAGVFLSQFLYWTPRTKDAGGWIYKTQADIYEETALTRREQETARRILREKGVLEEKKAGVPCKLYFRVNMQALMDLLGDEAEKPPQEPPEPPQTWQETAPSQDGGNVHPRMAQPAKLESPNPPDWPGQKRQTFNKEAENTAENTTKRRSTDPKPREENLPAPAVPEKPRLPAAAPVAGGAVRTQERAVTRDTWMQVTEAMRKTLPPGEAETRLTGTVLLEVTDTVARIAVPSINALLWLERRLYRQIASALKGVVGRDLDLQFILAS